MKDKMMMHHGMGGEPQGDIEILNYALYLEHLEADFYSRVWAAHQSKPFLKGRAVYVAQTLQRDEETHVNVVTATIRKLGGTPIGMSQYTFPEDAFTIQTAFLSIAADLEAVGVSAYLGQAPRVKSDDVLKAAASIYGNEARHVGLIRYLNGTVFSPDAVEMPRTATEVKVIVKAFAA